jgi:hypothetical protein
VCINQKDNEEKAQQVEMMGDIYSSASRTVIWLGESERVTRLDGPIGHLTGARVLSP